MEEKHEYSEQIPNNSEVVRDQQVKDSSEVLTCLSNEHMHSLIDSQEPALTPEHLSKSGCQEDAKSGIEQNMKEENKELGLEGVLSEVSENDNQIVSKLVGNDQTEANNLLSSNEDTENLALPIEVATTSIVNEGFEVLSEDANENTIKQMNPPVEDLNHNSSSEKLETVPIKNVNNSRELGRRDKKILRSKKKNYRLRSLVSSDRVLRSRIDEKPKAPEPNNNLNSLSTGEEGKRKKKKMRNLKGKGSRTDEFSMIKNRLRYLFNRIKYEQSLIDAYSSEGWKGFSLDKLKPEKELQRASSEIMRRKLKIRDLFQHLDSLCAKGRISESLFDSEGQIDSEDIFCAKCGSKELSLENDIILCDGVCDRGFHQLCLEPPLLNTDIPPDDEGWLCPGCDCKDDCIDLLNEFQGINLSILDSWEKVYPEAAAAAAGRNSGNDLGLPSVDSEDDDYDPDVPDTINQEDGSSSDETSSDESGYASAPEELEAPPNDDQFLGLPSDDSEDDNYDPDALDLEVGVNPESSSSDFTSDSEDLAAFDDNGSSKSDHPTPSSLNSSMSLKHSNGQSSECGPRKGTLHKELLTLLESGLDKDVLEPVSGRRQVERLDYKKLHDEAYGSDSTDSGDETYGSISVDSGNDRGQSGSTRKRSSRKLVPVSLNNGTNNLNLLESDDSPRRRTRQKPSAENVNNSVTKDPKDSLKSSSSGRRNSSSSNRRLDQHKLERLFASFRENQYPKRATKESLAQELGLSLKQVSKWFENTRWSTRHSSSVEANIAKSSSKTGIQLSQTTEGLANLEQESGMYSRDSDKNGAQHEESPKANSAVPSCQSGDTKDGKSVTPKTTRQEFTATKSRKRKSRSDHAALRPRDGKEPQKPHAKSPKVDEIKTRDKAKTRKRKSV